MANEMLALAFPDEEGPYELYRQTYKYTSCGPSVGFQVNGEWVYCDSLRKLGRWTEAGEITAISVSSIVEGVDQEAPARIIEIKDVWVDDRAVESSQALAKKFEETVAAVDKDADEIWKATHGCQQCAEHAGVDYETSCGAIPVWPECPGCSGQGEVI